MKTVNIKDHVMKKPPTKTELLSVLGMTEKEFEDLALDIWQNFPEASSGSSLRCIGFNYKEWKYKFLDTEKYDSVGANAKNVLTTDKAKCLAAVASFIVMKLQGQLQGIQISDFRDAGDYDAIAADAIAQLAVLGEIVYG